MAAFERIGLHKQSCRSEGSIIVTKHPVATAVGSAILDDGGSVFDAAIAAGFVLGVVEPYMSGIGGLGLALVNLGGTMTVFNAAPISPRGLDITHYSLASGDIDNDLFGWPTVQNDANLVGPTSVCTPTMVTLMESLHQHGGKVPWSQLIEPAITLARRSRVDWMLALNILNDQAALSRYPSTASVFLPGGNVPKYDLDAVGKPEFQQEELADTLQEIATRGAAAFYSGPVARTMVDFIQQQGGSLAADDLASFVVQASSPVSVHMDGYDVWVPNGLNGGATMAEMLRLYHSLATPDMVWGTAADLVAWVRAGSAAFADRFATMGHAGESQSTHAGATDWGAYQAPGGSTTYLAAADHDGNGVSLNLTLLSRWGSKLVVPGTGMLLNNGVMWFDPRPGVPNSLAAGVPPLANMAPVMSTRDGHLHAVLGASGGRRIISAVPQILNNVLRHGMNIQDAIAAPRLEFSTNPMLADPRLPHEALAEAEESTSRTFTRYSPRLGSSGYASPLGLHRDPSGAWTAGMDPTGLGDAACSG